ncbi:GNAT family N-acetyltransferase [Gimibacter soli]|uniref:GNAT family N-acetyltransferase n=1 Tax=Gimibacter soli TaxID=3024400 RepID=A0AAF0BJE8_9PROT|nr:GNAT family N-acetyltransferase [Gimibacter soli]WCL53039.1 GNAT family N-acetyltransferase [Gimibacter soli]
MKAETAFKPYGPDDNDACLALFDANCPAFFAPNERADYAAFLSEAPEGYLVCLHQGRIVGAFGAMPHRDADARSLNWILIDPTMQRLGIGKAMMAEAARQALVAGASLIHIAASQYSAPYFARFGAEEAGFIKDGWGPDMHCITMVWRLEEPEA